MPLTEPHANSGEWKVSAGIGVANTSATVKESEEPSLLVTGPTAELGCIVSLTDYWQAGLTVNWGPTFGYEEGVSQSWNANLEGRFVLDALTWVPYLSFGLGGLVRELPDGNGSAWRADASLFAGFGIDYRPKREWSVGFLARGHAVFTDETNPVGPFDAQIMASMHFD